MKNRISCVWALSLSFFLLSCGGEPVPSSSSEEAEKEKIPVTETNLALSDFETSLSSYFSYPNGGLSFSSAKEATPLLSFSFQSENPFSNVGSSPSKEGATLYDYDLSLYSDSLDFIYMHADKEEDFAVRFGSNSLSFDLSMDEESALSFKQGVYLYFATVEESSGFYLDLSKAAISRALIENLYPSIALNERSYYDFTDGFSLLTALFPLNAHASSFSSLLRSGVQEGLDNNKGSFYTYEGEERTYLAYSYDDASSFKEMALRLASLIDDPEKEKKAKETIERIESVSLSFDYSFDYERPYSLSIDGNILFAPSSAGGICSLSLSLKGDFLSEEASFALPKDLGDRSIWVS